MVSLASALFTPSGWTSHTLFTPSHEPTPAVSEALASARKGFPFEVRYERPPKRPRSVSRESPRVSLPLPKRGPLHLHSADEAALHDRSAVRSSHIRALDGYQAFLCVERSLRGTEEVSRPFQQVEVDDENGGLSEEVTVHPTVVAVDPVSLPGGFLESVGPRRVLADCVSLAESVSRRAVGAVATVRVPDFGVEASGAAASSDTGASLIHAAEQALMTALAALQVRVTVSHCTRVSLTVVGVSAREPQDAPPFPHLPLTPPV
jgi:hypothetical protein